MTPANNDSNQPPDDVVHRLDGKLSGRGCDDLHREPEFGPGDHQRIDGPSPELGPGPGPGPGLGPGPGQGPRAAGSSDPYDAGISGVDDLAASVAARRHGAQQYGAARERPSGTGRETFKARPGWYAYRAIGTAELPPWAVEVALTIERPVDPDPLGPAALVLLRAPLRSRWLTCVTEAAAEVESLAGVRPVAGADTIAGARPGAGSRLLCGPAMPGLTPVTPSAAQAGLAAAGARGLPAPLRRRQPATGGMEASWRWSPGAVVTCEGPCGLSAQAVVALGGLGSLAAIAPPPGGALVLRAWRARSSWGLSCGLVIGAAATLGLGREAGRAAARARAGGWDAVLLGGPTAMHLARAGSPAQAAPADAARAAAGKQVAALFEACLVAGGLGHPPAGSQQALSVTP